MASRLFDSKTSYFYVSVFVFFVCYWSSVFLPQSEHMQVWLNKTLKNLFGREECDCIDSACVFAICPLCTLSLSQCIPGQAPVPCDPECEKC